VGLLLALLVLRRFRHLIVLFILAQVLSLLAENVVAAIAQRPRPFGVEIREGWGGWAMPPLQSPTSRRRWSWSCIRWCRRAAGGTPASG
jgi:hypothetical protein